MERRIDGGERMEISLLLITGRNMKGVRDDDERE